MSELTVGLRFKRDQARALATLANKLESDGQTEHVSLFRQASDHARRGEPLIVVGENLMEIELMVAAFGQFPGVIEPIIQDVAATR